MMLTLAVLFFNYGYGYIYSSISKNAYSYPLKLETYMREINTCRDKILA